MNKLHPYEQKMADKLRQLEPPDVNRNWEQMRNMLDNEMPEIVVGGNNSPKWWLFGITAGIIAIGSWFGHEYQNKEAEKIAAKPAAVNVGTFNAAVPSTIKQQLQTVNDSLNTTHQNNLNDETTTLHNVTLNNNTVQNKLAVKPAELAAIPIKGDEKSSNPASKKVDYTNDVHTKQQPVLNNINNIKNADYKIAGNNLTNNSPQKTATVNNNQADKAKNESAINNLGAATIVYNNKTSADKDIAAKNRNEYTANGIAHGIVDENLYHNSAAVLENSVRELTPQTQIIIEPINLKNNIATGFKQPDMVGTAHLKMKPTANAAWLAKRSRKEQRDLNRSFNRTENNKEDHMSFAGGILLPHSVALSNQQSSNYNINANTGLRSDYIPVPYLQYHFNPKFFIHTEFEFQSPQLTNSFLVYQSTRNIAGSGYDMQKRIFVDKLYYFNLPVSVHYSPLRNFFVGTGLSYSSMISGVARFEQKRILAGNPIPGENPYTSVSRFQDDSISQQLSPHDLRMQLDANYYWKRFTLGARYNQALNRVVDLQVLPNLPPTQASNRSFQFYMRFNIWEERKRKDNFTAYQ